MSLSIWHILVVAIVVFVLFGGAGRFPRMMEDLAKGVKSFKKGLKEEDVPPKAIDHQKTRDDV